MTNWARGQWPKYDIPAEREYFAKLVLAITFHEIDEAVIDRQRTQWKDDLQAMLAAQAPPTSAIDGAQELPEGVTLQIQG